MSKNKQVSFPWSDPENYIDAKTYSREEMERVYDWLIDYVDESANSAEEGSGLGFYELTLTDLPAITEAGTDLVASPVTSQSLYQVNVQAGVATYTRTVNLEAPTTLDVRKMEIRFDVKASTNQTVIIKDFTSGDTLSTIVGVGVAYITTQQFMYNGANWSLWNA